MENSINDNSIFTYCGLCDKPIVYGELYGAINTHLEHADIVNGGPVITVTEADTNLEYCLKCKGRVHKELMMIILPKNQSANNEDSLAFSTKDKEPLEHINNSSSGS